MSLIKVNIVLSICVYFTNVFGFYNLLHGYGLLLEDTSIPTSRTKVAERSIIQPLDHFNNSDKRTWTMRYFEQLEFWEHGGPLFLYINGEAEARETYIQRGLIHELAEEMNGALYLSEHRYYGKSKPFSEMNAKNLAYLSSRQALADIAKLLKQLKSLPQYNGSKVVVVGGSYAGNLAAWMRLLYRDLVDAAIASSAPVLAKADFYEYLETVGTVYKQYGTSECYNKIATKFNSYDRLFQTSAGIEQLKQEEDICYSTDLSRIENKYMFFLYKASYYVGSVQYGTRTKIKQDCDNINNILYSIRGCSSNDSSSLFELGHWNKEHSCYECTFDGYIKSIKENDNAMPWTYQTCTEFGYFQTTTSLNQPFANNILIEISYSTCSKLYGAEFNKTRVDEGVKKTNDMYGGLRPNVTKVVFVNGDIDPWHSLGVLRNLSKEAPAKLIHGSSHSTDLGSEKPEDPKELKKTRKFVKSLIKKWIGVAQKV